MTEPEETDAVPAQQDEAEQRHEPRRYQVSANRGRARHRLRYVESGGATEEQSEGECGLCRDLPVR
ncbi:MULTISPECIES: hypothetical protein [Gammaproteobacteria]|jgi:hypothetical protein|uniref:Uncharacterized protein n=2 Tax=Halomonadaceae TaxID=28256 RepID=A0A2A2F7B4_9GAMM|nr:MULTISPECIES: hypothetical protein [Gammaproteobacteria]KAA8985238.1 hypothetical protein F3089_00680 [Halospina sp. K52047b]MYL25648.1 hypothetical protein [Halomonas utahensis]MYL74884.1 hypothetical protein [Halomonas sp. 22501_18_FS]PAU80710.1 hypothetical protein CK501_09880 [Halovibrio salipaludis]